MGIKISELRKDPIAPEIVLLGLILLSFFPLKNFPKHKPPTSVKIVTSIE